MQYCTHNCHDTYAIYFPNIVTVCSCFYQVTIHNKFSKSPPPELMHAWTVNGMLFPVKSLGVVLNALICIKMRWEMSANLQWKLNSLRVLFPTDKTKRDWGRVNMGHYVAAL